MGSIIHHQHSSTNYANISAIHRPLPAPDLLWPWAATGCPLDSPGSAGPVERRRLEQLDRCPGTSFRLEKVGTWNNRVVVIN